MELAPVYCKCIAFHLVNKLHDFKGIHYLSGKFCYDDFFRKTHARLYLHLPPIDTKFSLTKMPFSASQTQLWMTSLPTLRYGTQAPPSRSVFSPMHFWIFFLVHFPHWIKNVKIVLRCGVICVNRYDFTHFKMSD